MGLSLIFIKMKSHNVRCEIKNETQFDNKNKERRNFLHVEFLCSVSVNSDHGDIRQSDINHFCAQLLAASVDENEMSSSYIQNTSKYPE